MFAVSDYDYHLPEKCIAQEPSTPRERSRLLYMKRYTGFLAHHTFTDIINWLNPGDVLAVNDTRVVPARLFGRKETGGKIELLILNYAQCLENYHTGSDIVCQCMLKASKRPREGTVLILEQGLRAEVLQFCDGIFTVRFRYAENFETLIFRIGKTPLPPYIKRNGNISPDDKNDYQTVYARQNGAVAAPTAGLHFSTELLDQIRAKGVLIAAITLHVGHGTFAPVRTDDIREHQIHSEWFTITEETASVLNKAERIIAVGTTCVRTLEFASDKDGRIRPGSGQCDLFIYPGYKFKVTDALITNFHLPQSTLLMLVSAFADRQNILNAYKTAISEGYRFYSYGDAMLIA
ncbi:tRNA preQ1(34) S-adenosylmethionine ribosyltransferase-isomerase QueA [Desulfococcaceae bacterium HSG7]|nr:tRNA preQ1(34) S-adenosylmethionine ribosyltransferase-isomerase QueA [Desulfococcaceae bacterium HSG7]